MLGRGGLSAFAQRGLGTLYALLLDFKNGIYQQTRTRTNKCTNNNSTPTATTNMTKGGDAASTLTVVSDIAALNAVNLSGNGNVYKLDNTAGVADAYVITGGLSGNTNTHTSSAAVRGSGTVKIGGFIADASLGSFTLMAGYIRQSKSFAAGSNSDQFRIQVTAGSVVYFVLNQFEEAPAASAYIPTTSAAVSVTESITDQTPVRTNFVTGSKDMLTGWGPTAATAVVSSAALPPALVGLATGAVDLTFTTPAANDRLVQSVTLSAGTYTQSIWAKTSSGTKNFRLGGLNNASPDFTATTTWQRFSWVSTATPSGVFYATVLNEAAGSAGGVTIAGYQIEAGNTLGGFIPTGSTIVTVGAVTNLYGYTYSRSGAKEEVGTTYGPELVTNGDFGTPASWSTSGSGWSVSGGVALVNVGAGRVYQAATLTDGKTYQVTFTVVTATAGDTCFVLNGATKGAVGTARSTPGTYTETIDLTGVQNIGGSGVNTIALSSRTANFSGTIDNLSVKEVIPASSFAANVPAIIPGTGYFARPAYTNLVLYSQTFTNAAGWSPRGSTVTDNQAVAPDGSSTASKVIEGVASNQQAPLSASISFTTGQAYTFSVFAKLANGTRFLQMYTSFAIGGNSGAVFNLTNGTVAVNTAGTGSGTSSITAVGNGWYRCTQTFTAQSTGTGVLLFNGAASSATALDTAYTGDGTSGFYLWQAQVVQASDPGPIIVTTSATAAVGADTLALPLTMPSGDFTFVGIGTAPPQDGAHHVLASIEVDSSNRIEIDRGGGNTPRVTVSQGGVTTIDTASPIATALYNTPIAAGAELRLAVVRASGAVSIYIGGALQSCSAGYTDSPKTLAIGERFGGQAQFGSTVNKIAFANYAMTAAQIAAL